LVFADAHVDVQDGWLPPLLETLMEPDVGCVGPVLRERDGSDFRGYGLYFCDDATNVEWVEPQGVEAQAVPLLLGFCVAIRREVFALIGGYDPGMLRWGMEDNELSIRAWRCGYECRVVPNVEVSHLSRVEQPPDYQLDWQTAVHNILRLGTIHFARPRLVRLLEAYRDDPVFPDALATVISSDASERRRAFGEPPVSETDFFFQSAMSFPGVQPT
jgi:GT2 family glycosyltransferase